MQASFWGTEQGKVDRVKSGPGEQMEILQHRWQGEWWESSGPNESMEKHSRARIDA